MHRNPFGGRAQREPVGGADSAPPDLLAGLRGEGPHWKAVDKERGDKEKKRRE